MTKITCYHDLAGTRWGDDVGPEYFGKDANVRVWRPGSVGTMELKTGRINVHLDAEGNITKIEVEI